MGLLADWNGSAFILHYQLDYHFIFWNRSYATRWIVYLQWWSLWQLQLTWKYESNLLGAQQGARCHIKCIIFNFIFHPISRFGYFSWDPFRCSLKWCLYIRIGCWIENPFLLWYNASEEITTNNKQLSSFKICIPDVDDTHFLGNVKSLFTYPFSTFKLLSGRTDISCPLKSTEKMESPCMNPALSHFGAGPILYLMIFTFPSLSIYCFEESCVQTPDGILLNERWVCYRSHLYRF